MGNKTAETGDAANFLCTSATLQLKPMKIIIPVFLPQRQGDAERESNSPPHIADPKDSFGAGSWFIRLN